MSSLPGSYSSASSPILSSSGTAASRTSTTATSTHGGHGAPTSGPSNEEIASYLNIATWGIFGLLVLASIPRLLHRYRHPSGKRSSLRLKKAKVTPVTSASAVQPAAVVFPRPRLESSHTTEQSEAKDSNYASDLEPATPVDELPSSTSAIVTHPSRTASWTARLRPVTRYLAKPFWFTGYSHNKVVIMAIYMGFIVFGSLYHNLPSFGPRRSGWLVVGQFPLVFALGAKNNLVGFLLGTGYEKLNVWHRWVGKTMFLAVMFHVVGYLVMFAKKGILVSTIRGQGTGWLAFSGLCLLCVISLPPIRRSAYTVFWHAHWIGYVFMLIGICFHADNAWQYSVAAAAIIVTDHICRIYKTVFVTASITPVPELGCTRVEVSHLARGWRAGQHVRLRAISLQMGFLQTFEAHPFTIASVTESTNREGLILYVKKAGDWTNKLFDIANTNATDAAGKEKAVPFSTADRGSSTMRMILEGPYGGPGHDVFSSFSAAFIVAGGSGITFGLSTVDEIVHEAEHGRAKTRLIQLVWVIQDPTSMFHLAETLRDFLNRAARTPSLRVSIAVYYTRAITLPTQEKLGRFSMAPGLEVYPGRPKFPTLVDRLLTDTVALKEGPDGLRGVMVGCCGPESLVEAVMSAERGVANKERELVGGIETMEEMFAW